MALTVETKPVRPRLAENGIMYVGIEATIKEGTTVLAVETFTEAATPGTDPGLCVPALKAKVQALLDRCDKESKLMADVKYAALATAAKDGVKVKGT